MHHLLLGRAMRCLPLWLNPFVFIIVSRLVNERGIEPSSDQSVSCYVVVTIEQPKDGEPVIRVLTAEPVVVIDNYFRIPIGKTDALKAPDHFPCPVYRYTLTEMSIVWSMYGGRDFESSGDYSLCPSASWWPVWCIGSGIGHMNIVKLHKSWLVQPSQYLYRPTQLGLPFVARCNEYWRYFQTPLGKKWGPVTRTV